MSDVARHPSSAISAARTEFAGLAPLFLVIFLGFLSVGAPLPALSLYVHDSLGFSPSVVGWVIGIQSLATVLTRHRAGALCDRRGPRRAVLLGLPLAALSGMFYLASVWAPLNLEGRLGVLLIGRVTLGLGESLFITGAMSWGIARIGAARTGKVMSWQGMAIYAAIGLGAPLGLAVQGACGFVGVAILTIATPLLAGAIALRLPAAPASGGGDRTPFYRVLGLIWRPGLVLTLATVPFAAMATFLALDYAARDWSGAGLALTGFGAGYILVRLVGSHLPDRFGGAKVAGASLAIEALGQLLLWSAPGPDLAFIGATLTGVGFSLVFPAMGVEATRRVPPEQRGRAVGNFIAFFDVAIGLTGPAVGIVAGRFGYAFAFLIGAGATLIALALLTGVRRPNVTR
ncbi:MFS transporter [Methylocapsa sp. S129]|uniref:MFS transporter n=1 Tax=Methylocapsa sp. S129 TaxID=1641869 RepID=UPI00131AAB80|nr:MFS transporter [Methylocapsa sp. S129]